MISPPDKYLQDQFAHLRKSPPSEAWDRIQSGLDKNKSKRIWLRVAAAVLFLLAATVSLWQINKTTTDVQVVTSKPAPLEKNITQPSKIIPAPATENQTSSPVTSNTNTPFTTPVSPIKTRQAQMSPNTEISKDVTSTNTDIVATPVLNPSVTEQKTEVEPQDEEVIAMTPQVQQKISYSAADVNARFIKKNDPLTAPPAAKSETGFKKIIDIAYDLKYDESALGDLRQIKNELLSFPVKENLREK